jgi:hypothetical protein
MKTFDKITIRNFTEWEGIAMHQSYDVCYHIKWGDCNLINKYNSPNAFSLSLRYSLTHFTQLLVKKL